MVPMPQSTRYSRPSTISTVDGSDRSSCKGGPPLVPRKRISVSLRCGATRPLWATAAAESMVNARMTAVGKHRMSRGNKRYLPLERLATQATLASLSARQGYSLHGRQYSAFSRHEQIQGDSASLRLPFVFSPVPWTRAHRKLADDDMKAMSSPPQSCET